MIPAGPSPIPIPSITGGEAKSGVGDSAFSTEFRGNGLNYTRGVPAWMIAMSLAVAALGVGYFVLKPK